MGVGYNPKIVTDGLVLCLDAANNKSYPDSGTTWSDLSGNGNNGTLINGPTYDSAYSGSLAFDGVNDVIRIPYSSTYVDSNSKTVEVWLKVGNIGAGFVQFITNRADSDVALTFAIGIDNRRVIRDWNPSGTDYMVLYYGVGANSQFRTAFSKEKFGLTNGDNQFHQVVGVTDTSSNQLKLYYDGSLIDSESFTQPVYASTANTRLGAGYNDSLLDYPLTGNIANTKIYNRALSAEEVKQNYDALKRRFAPPPIVGDGLVLNLDAGNFRSYSGTGTAWNDLSGNDNNATLTNGPTYNSANGGSLLFDGVNDYSIIPYTPILAPTSQITLAAWVTTDWQTTGNVRILSKTEVGGYQLSINDIVGQIGCTIHVGGTYRYCTVDKATVTAGWHHMLVTCDGRYIKLYFDSVLVATTDLGSYMNLTYAYNNPFIIASEPGSAEPTNTNFINANIAQVFVYNRALSAQEVQQNFEANRGRYGI